jgi:hypothetical protein
MRVDDTFISGAALERLQTARQNNRSGVASPSSYPRQRRRRVRVVDLFTRQIGLEIMDVVVRRHWNDWQKGKVLLEKLDKLHWDRVSGGHHAPAPQPFIYGYTLCTDIEGEIGHSCLHGEGPHRIKVCIVKKDNNKEVMRRLLDIVGPKPRTRPIRV